jgi:signal transduction histidine kinase
VTIEPSRSEDPARAAGPDEAGAPRRLERVVHRLARLQNLTASLARTRDLSEIAGVIIDEAMPSLGAEVGVVAILSEDGRTLRNVGFKGVPRETEEAWQEYSVDAPVPVAEAARDNRTIVVTTVEERNRRYPALAAVHGVEHGGAVIAMPLQGVERPLGVLAFCFPTARDLDADERSFLHAIAHQCAQAVERARLYELAQREIETRKASEKALREAEEALREEARRKDVFIALLAHELRNPLAPIRNALAIVRRLGLEDPALLRAREMIERQVAHMVRLVDDLLDVSRITQGKIALRRELLELGDLLRAAAEDHRPLLAAGGLALDVALPPAPVWVDADATRVSQAIGNLLQNAMKFTDPGGRVALRADPLGEERVAVTVEDTGIGMDGETLARVFEPFAQAAPGQERGGLGLGLALVKGLVELHGGAVDAASDGPGRGSRITFVLPIAGAGGPSPAPSSRPPAPSAAARGRRVLLIEDNVDAAESMQMLLEMCGHEVALAHAGAEGIARAAAFAPEVILCDIGLPGAIDGYGVARALRGAPGPRPHLIALTGFGQEEDKRRARDAGFDAHLTKPVDPTLLERMLREAS